MTNDLSGSDHRQIRAPHLDRYNPKDECYDQKGSEPPARDLISKLVVERLAQTKHTSLVPLDTVA
jgi:hypothetical protein